MNSAWKPSKPFACLLAAGIVFGALALAPATAAGQDAEVTFSEHIAPILQRSCENCHRPRGGAPMALINYQDVRPWARAIRNRTSAREMPPWFIDKNIGVQRFKDDPSLSDEEVAAIAAWVDNGAPQGNPAHMPPPLEWPADGWTYGTPDVIVPSPEGTVEAEAADWFGEWGVTPTGIPADRYIKAVEVKEVRLDEAPAPESTVDQTGRADLSLFVVHHAVISAEQLENTLQPLDCGNETSCTANDDQLWLTYELGQNPTIFPDEVGVKLPAGTLIHVMAWYNNSVTNKNVVDPRNWKGYGNRSIDDMFFSITRTIELTEEEFQAEVAARGGTPLFSTSQDQ